MERIPHLRIAATSASTGLVSIALVLFFRRTLGATLRDLSAGEVVVYTALFAVACTASARELAAHYLPARRAATGWPAASLIMTLTFLAGLTTDPTSILAGCLTGAAVIGFAALADRQRASIAAEAKAKPSPAVPMSVASPAFTEEEFAPSISASDLRLELVRTDAAAGEQVAGLMRFETVPGETVKTLHVPLWPPLAGEPIVRCDLEGLDGRISVPYSKPHGFRIEVRLPEAIDEPLEGIVRFVAKCGVRSAAA